MNILLRKISLADLDAYQYWKLPQHKYHQLNGPYFRKKTTDEIALETAELRLALTSGHPDPLPDRRIISNADHEVLGEVNWYWKSEETNWLEIGIVIFDEQNWGQGIGLLAMQLWIAQIFRERPELVRIGLTTWSGNAGMMKLAEKLEMQKEAYYRKARIVDGHYYDSISYGLLKEEWAAFNA